MTYKELYEATLKDAKNGSQMAAAQLIAVTQGMQAEGADAQVNQAQISARAADLMRKNSFRQTMRDPEAKEMLEKGSGQQVVDLFMDYDNPKMTYRKFLRGCKQDMQNRQEVSPAMAANMVAASMVMQGSGANAEVDQKVVSEMATKLMSQSAFKEMVKDPKALELMKQGKSLDLIQLMADKQYEKEHRNDEYRRIPGQLQEDGQILSDYLTSVAGTADAGAVSVVRKGKVYTEMIRQMQAAQTKMAQGIPLSGDEAKTLADAVQKYNNNGSPVAGGIKAKNAHYTQNMALLKRFMPPKEFNAYCADIKQEHPQRETAPENFVPGRLNGKVKTAAQLKAEYRASLQRSFSEEGVAAICAINKMAKGDKYCLITPDRLKFETDRMLANGTAFHRTIMNASDKKVLKELSDRGDISGIAKEVQARTIKHTIGTAQWHVNNSARALQGERLNRHQASYHLATIAAAGSVAQNAKNLSVPIDKTAFADAVAATMANKDFQRMVDRYESDPTYRQSINSKLSQTGGAIVSQELYKYEHQSAKKQAQAEPAKPEQPKKEEAVPQAQPK